MSRVVDVLIAIFWLLLVTDAFLEARELPHLLAKFELPELPLFLFATATLAIAGISSLIIFRQRRQLMDDLPIVASWTDRFFGGGAYSRFTHKLRPVWTSIATSLVFGFAGLHATHEATRDTWAYAICGGTLLFALGMYIAYLASKRFPPELR